MTSLCSRTAVGTIVIGIVIGPMALATRAGALPLESSSALNALTPTRLPPTPSLPLGTVNSSMACSSRLSAASCWAPGFINSSLADKLSASQGVQP